MFERLVVPGLIILGLAEHDVVERFAEGFLVKIPEVVQFSGIVFDPFFDNLVGSITYGHFFVDLFKISISH